MFYLCFVKKIQNKKALKSVILRLSKLLKIIETTAFFKIL